MSNLLKVALLLSVTASSWSCGKNAKTPAQQSLVGAQQAPAALPSGCAVAAMINTAAFPASAKIWKAFLDARGLKGSELKAAGVDVQRDLTWVGGRGVATRPDGLIESAKVAGVDPVAYLVEITTRAKRTPGAVLLPDNFKAAA